MRCYCDTLPEGEICWKCQDNKITGGEIIMNAETERMLIIEAIEMESKNSVGYKESSDKEEFMKGVNVAARRAFELYDGRIKNYHIRIQSLTATRESLQNDMSSLANILKRHMNFGD